MKTQLLTGLVFGLILLLGGSFGTASDKPGDAVKKKLDTPITMKGEERNTPLKDVLDYFREVHGLAITIDMPAFAKLSPAAPELAPIRFVEQKDVPLGKVLQRLLDQIPATYKVQGNGIIIIPPQKVKT